MSAAAGGAYAAPAGQGADRRYQRGRYVYDNYCYFCHGYRGDARTVASGFLNPRPRDFTALTPGELDRAAMIEAVTRGRPGSAMMGFAQRLEADDIAAVVDYIRATFIARRPVPERYHTAANGWTDHERYRDAFPFALGRIASDAPDEDLTPAQRRGKRLYLSACVTCHDAGRVKDTAVLWEPRPVSYPRGDYAQRQAGAGTDAISGATPYARHERAPLLAGLDQRRRRGEVLYQSNCAFCHAADGTGRNWIGSFLEPHPRNLTDRAATRHLTPARLRQAIAEGLPDSTMPAWKTVLSPDEIDAIAAYVETAFLPVGGETAGPDAPR